MEVGIRVTEAFPSVSFIPVRFPLDYTEQLKALFISKSYHAIICTSIRGKHNRLAAGQVNILVEGKTYDRSGEEEDVHSLNTFL